MILTKDNILRFIKQNKFVLPTQIASEFDTSTMIASAALSELVKDKLIGVSYLKSSSSPYYFDIKQKEALIELGQKHLSGTDLEVFNKLKEQQIISKSALSIPEQVAIGKLQDFAKELEFQHQGKDYFFWVWYLRDLSETKKQIMAYFSDAEKTATPQKNQNNKKTQEVETKKPESNNNNNNGNINTGNQNNQNQNAFERNIINAKDNNINYNQHNNEKNISKQNNQYQNNDENFQQKQESFRPDNVEKDHYEEAIENYLRKNYLKIENKQKTNEGISYNVKLKLISFETIYDCFYFEKKPQEADIISFYVSSIKPKIIFVKQAPKKLYKLTEKLDNIELVNL